MSTRKLVLDTETTGLHASKGDRIVSIAALEVVDDELTGDFFHYYLNPERPCDPGAAKIHGLTDDFLAQQPTFKQVATDIESFLGDSPLIIHNAPFDLAFLSAEFYRAFAKARAGWIPDTPNFVCTLSKARAARGWGGKGHNTLDTLAKVYGAQSFRTTEKHGALVDCLTLYGVYRGLFGLGQRPLIDSEVEHYLDVTQGMYYVWPADFAALRAGSPSLPQGEANFNVPAHLRASGSRAGEDVLGAAPVPDATRDGLAEPVVAADGDHPSGGRTPGLVDPLLAAVRRGGI